MIIIILVSNAAIHATTPTAHDALSSRFIDATAAMHGVYKRLKTKREAAATGEITSLTGTVKSTSRVDTTLSFASIPVINDVHIL